MDEDEELQRLFLSEAHRRVQGMREALHDDDGGRYALFRHAHSLKGLAGSLGHDRLEEIARDLVHRLRPEADARPADLSDEVSELAREVERIERRRHT